MMGLLAFGTLPCVFHHSHQYYLWCVFADGADDTLVMHRPVCTTQMHAADKMAMSRCWRCALPLKTVYFLCLQLGQDDRYYICLEHSLVVVGYYLARQLTNHLVASSNCIFQAVFPCY